MKYGTEIKVLNGMFEGCNGIFFSNAKDNECTIEVFFKTPAIECPIEANDYFRDYLFNEKTPKKTTSAMIRLSKKDIEEETNG